MTEADVLAEAARGHEDVVRAAGLPRGAGAIAIIVQLTGYVSGPELRAYVCRAASPSRPPDVVVVERWPADVAGSEDEFAGFGATEFPYSEPSTATESELAELWSRCLELAPVGVLDHFADLGGDSMAAIELSMAIADRWQVDVPLDLFVDPGTVTSVARYLDEHAS